MNHPHLKYQVNNDLGIGFVRISKNGSQSATQTLKLNEWIGFSSATPPGLILCAVREPTARILSSVFETLKRATFNCSIFWGDVPVKLDVYKDICEIDVTSPAALVDSFFDIIRVHGWFDAHHEPQCNFLFDRGGAPLIDPLVFPLKKMNSVLQRVIKQYSIPTELARANSKQVDTTTAAAGNLTCSEEDSAQARKSLAAGGYDSKDCRSNRVRIFPVTHPLSRLLKLPVHAGVAVIKPSTLDHLLSNQYKLWLGEKSVHYLASNFVESYYKGDSQLFRIAEEAYKGFNETSFDSLPRLKNLLN